MDLITKRIYEIADVVGGGTPSTSNEEYWGGDIPWLSPADLTGYQSVYISHGEKFITPEGVKKSSTQRLPAGSVLFSSRAPIGYIAIAQNEIYTNQGFKSLVCKSEVINNLYLYYYLKLNLNYIKNFASGATFPELSANRIKNIKITFCKSLHEQQKIASILSAYDSQIENNQKRIKLLEQMAENLYKEWFVRFRFPGYETAEFEGGMPKGWNVEKLKKFITFYRGKSYSSDDISSGDYVLLSMNNIRPWGGYIRDDSRVYGGSFKDFQLIHKGDLIMSITDMTQDRRIIGYVGIFDEERDDCIMSTHLMKVVSEYNNYYLYGLFNFSLSRYISEYATGANVLGLTDKILKEIKALVPPEKLISQYGKMVRPVWEEIFHLKDEIANLTKQRDLLLPRLMSGKLSI